MKITRTEIPRAHVDANVQVSHCNQDGPDDWQEITVVLSPYVNAADLIIAGVTLSIPDYAIPEVITMLKGYQKQMRHSMKNKETKK